MTSPINKQPEGPQNRYDLPPPATAPIEESFIPGMAPDEVSTKPIRDQITPSTAAASSQHVKRPDVPELPIPSLKAINRAGAQAAAKKEALEKAQVASSAGAEAVNPWKAAPALLAVLFQVLYDIQAISSQTRFTEAQLKAKIEEYAFKIGTENADLSKNLKELAANKEFIRAVGSFINAGVAGYQLTSVAKARGKAEEEANKEFDPKIERKREKVDELRIEKERIDAANAAAARSGAPAAPIPDPGTPARAVYDKEKAVPKELVKAEKELKDLEKQKREALNIGRQEEGQKASATADIFKQTTEGCIGVLAAVYTGREGETEKQKGINDALMQIFHKLGESTSKSKEDLQQSAERVLQQIERTTEANLNAHRMGRG